MEEAEIIRNLYNKVEIIRVIANKNINKNLIHIKIIYREVDQDLKVSKKQSFQANL